MLPKKARREEILHRLSEGGGLTPGASGRVHRETGVPEADVFGAASFYTLLTDPDSVRVCQGLSCCLHDCASLKRRLEGEGRKAVYASCLGRCDAAPAAWDPHREIELPATGLTPSDGPYELVIDLAAPDAFDRTVPYPALAAARDRGADWVVAELEAAGLTGRGGAGFPAHVKWSGVRRQAVHERYVVLNADEGEPGTFKDREVMLRRPHLVIEGLAIAAVALGAQEVWVYVRGEFAAPRLALEAALAEARDAGALPDGVSWHFHEGQGAYICGEETALLESMEGKRGMPRMKPPFPVEVGFRGKPTLIQNVETIACVPAILERGGAWFRGLGRTEAGTKLYCLSGHVVRPGVYEAPMGVSLARAAGARRRRRRHAQGVLAGRRLQRLPARRPRRPAARLQGARRGRLDARLGRHRGAQHDGGHGGGGALPGGVLRGRVVRPVLALPHRHAGPAPRPGALPRERRPGGAGGGRRGGLGHGRGEHLRPRPGGAAAADQRAAALPGGVRAHGGGRVAGRQRFWSVGVSAA